MEVNNLLERIKGKEVGYNSVSCELVELDIDKKNGTIFHRISSGALDRDNSIVHQDGIDRTNYQKNPAVLFNHGSHRGILGADNLSPEEILKFTIARSQSQRLKDGDLHGKTEFYLKKDFPREVFEYTIDGFLPGWSIGFIPVEAKYEKDKKGNEVLHYYKIDLLEYSKVPLGSNPQAVNEMKKFAKTDEMIKSLDFYEKNNFAVEEAKNILEYSELKSLVNELMVSDEANTIMLKSLKGDYFLTRERSEAIEKQNESLLKEIDLLKTKDITKEINNQLSDITELITLRLEKKFKDLEIAGKNFTTQRDVYEIVSGAIRSVYGKKLKY